MNSLKKRIKEKERGREKELEAASSTSHPEKGAATRPFVGGALTARERATGEGTGDGATLCLI
jgi:hypothetical protein